MARRLTMLYPARMSATRHSLSREMIISQAVHVTAMPSSTEFQPTLASPIVCNRQIGLGMPILTVRRVNTGRLSGMRLTTVIT